MGFLSATIQNASELVASPVFKGIVSGTIVQIGAYYVKKPKKGTKHVDKVTKEVTESLIMH